MDRIGQSPVVHSWIMLDIWRCVISTSEKPICRLSNQADRSVTGMTVQVGNLLEQMIFTDVRFISIHSLPLSSTRTRSLRWAHDTSFAWIARQHWQIRFRHRTLRNACGGVQTSTVASRCSIVQRGVAVDVHGRSEAASAGRRLCESVAVKNSHVQMNQEEREAHGQVVICRDEFAAEYGHTDVCGPCCVSVLRRLNGQQQVADCARDIEGNIPLQHCAMGCRLRRAWTKWSWFCRKTPLWLLGRPSSIGPSKQRRPQPGHWHQQPTASSSGGHIQSFSPTCFTHAWRKRFENAPWVSVVTSHRDKFWADRSTAST